MHATVLTDFEVGEMKAERLRLPDELVHFTVCLSRGAGVDERGLQGSQVFEQFLRSRVGEGKIAAPRRRDTLGAQQEELAVRLARCACLDCDSAIADDLPCRAEPAEKTVARRRGVGVGG